MNKKLYTIVITVVFGLGWLLSACAGQPALATVEQDHPVASEAVDNPAPDAPYPMPAAENSKANPGYPAPGADNPGAPPGKLPNEGQELTMPMSIQLALGTLKLEGTDLAVTPEQAANLLLLWKVVDNLNRADEVKAEDLETAFEQIQDAMTAEQMEAIQSMNLTMQDIATLAEELGIEIPSAPFATLTSEQQATMQANAQNGPPPGGTPGAGGPGGGFPGGGGTPPAGGAQNPPGNGTPPARPGGQGGFETIIYQAVIKLLETKTQ